MKNKIGLSITEVVIAMGLLGLSIGGILGVLMQNTRTGQSNDYTYVATNIAKNRIEMLREVRRDRGYPDLVNWNETDTVVDRNGIPDPDGDFERTTTIDAAYGTNLTEVTVSVRYRRDDTTYAPVATELVTLISPYYE